MNALILLAFLALFLFAGKKLFDVRDWGKHPASTGQASSKHRASTGQAASIQGESPRRH